MPDESPSRGFWYWLRVAAVGRRPKRTLLRLAVLMVAAVVVFKFALLPIRVVGLSMEPTFHDHAINFINRLAYVRGQPRRGDVVGIRFSTNLDAAIHVMLLKRVVGLPGETISFAGGYLCINGDPQDEPYLKLRSDWNEPGKSLGPNEYYFVGDNRSMPPGQHEHGVAFRSQIVGRVLFKGNQ
ncbi:MAG: signal peptidase I [Verrucomicrobiota bacterium]|jgi:signal peptidase I